MAAPQGATPGHAKPSLTAAQREKEMDVRQIPANRIACILATTAVIAASGVAAQESNEDLAKQVSNPIASLISVPMQFNWDNQNGPEDGQQVVRSASHEGKVDCT